MTRRSDFQKEGTPSLRDFSLKCSETLDKGVDTYKSINELSNIATAAGDRNKGEIHCALDEMESVIEHLAAATTGGDIDKTREALRIRGLGDVI